MSWFLIKVFNNIKNKIQLYNLNLLLPPIPCNPPPNQSPYSSREMSDEGYTRDESDTDIDGEHRENLWSHRMTSRIEIDPEIW